MVKKEKSLKATHEGIIDINRFKIKSHHKRYKKHTIRGISAKHSGAECSGELLESPTLVGAMKEEKFIISNNFEASIPLG